MLKNVKTVVLRLFMYILSIVYNYRYVKQCLYNTDTSVEIIRIVFGKRDFISYSHSFISLNLPNFN